MESTCAPHYMMKMFIYPSYATHCHKHSTMASTCTPHYMMKMFIWPSYAIHLSQTFQQHGKYTCSPIVWWRCSFDRAMPFISQNCEEFQLRMLQFSLKPSISLAIWLIWLLSCYHLFLCESPSALKTQSFLWLWKLNGDYTSITSQEANAITL